MSKCLECPHCQCKEFTAKSEKWSGYCRKSGKQIANLLAYRCQVVIEQSLF